MKTTQESLMIFDPVTNCDRPYPSHAAQYREWHGKAAWRFNPWTGFNRSALDIGSDPTGLLILPPGEELLAAKPMTIGVDNVDTTVTG